MNYPLITTSIILVVSIILFLSDRLRPDLIAILVFLSLGITQILTPQETFSGFSRSAIFTLIGIFIMAEGLRRTGVSEKIGRLMLRIGGTTEKRLIAVVVLTGSFLSLFMNNIAAATVLLPAAMGSARKSGVKPSKLLIPLAFGTILGGTATLFTTVNIIVNSLLRDRGLKGFGLLEFLPLGIPLIIAGSFYIVYFGRKSLPAITLDDRIDAMRAIEPDLPAVYRLDERLAMATIDPGSPLSGVALDQSRLRETFHVNLVALKRGEKILSPPMPALLFQPGDTLLLEGRPEDFSEENLQQILHFTSLDSDGAYLPTTNTMILMETVLAPRSALIGKSLRDIMFREKFNMNVLAVWRAGKPIRTRFTDQPLQFGDTLLLQGPRDRLRMLRSDPDLIVLADKEAELIGEPSKARLAAIILLIVLSLGAIGLVSIGEIMLAGAIFMVLFGILNIDQAYQAIEWKSIFLVAGMLPMGVALLKTGAATLFADNIFRLLGNANPIIILAVLFILTVLLTQVISGPVVAAIVAPIAIEISTRTGIDPRSFAIGVAIAASMAFITPLGHPVNVLVMGLAGYKFRDFRRIGLPLTILLFLVVMLLLPVLWPFTKV